MYVKFSSSLISAVCLDALEIYEGSDYRTLSFEPSVSVTQHADSQITECVVDRGGACLEVSKDLWTYLFFSCEPFDQTLLVNLVLSNRARGGSSCLSFTGATVYMRTPGSGPGCSFGNCCETCTVCGGSCPVCLLPHSQWGNNLLAAFFCNIYLV